MNTTEQAEFCASCRERCARAVHTVDITIDPATVIAGAHRCHRIHASLVLAIEEFLAHVSDKHASRSPRVGV